MKPWIEWEDEDIRVRKPEALSRYREMLAPDIELFIYIQYLFYKQWNSLREYLNKLEIKTIGDIPIYVPLDSADVWSEPRFFQLDDRYIPKCVAGVPPDYFSKDGQLWGNPLYDWDVMRSDGYGWWIRRIDGAIKLYDMIRIDHFRGFSEYWAVPYGDTTARNGKWMKGPGMDLIGVLSNWFRNTSFIAEDLGTPTDDLRQLLKDSGWPGMKVLEFAFDSDEESDFLPHSYQYNCICYTGTHDNASLLEWLEDANADDAVFAFDYLGIADCLGDSCDAVLKAKEQSGKKVPSTVLKLNKARKEAFVWAVIRAGQSSTADLFIAQMQDYLTLGKGCRMNVPSKAGGNWTFRLLPGETDEKLAKRIRHMTGLYGRLR